MAIKARDMMSDEAIFTVSPETTVGELKHLLMRERVSAAPVLDSAGHLVGIVSQRDVVELLDRSFSTEAEPSVEAVERFFATTVGSIMETELHTVSPEADIAAIAKTLRTHHIHRVLVVEGERLVGLISTLDFARPFEDSRLVAEIVKWKPWTPFRHAREEMKQRGP